VPIFQAASMMSKALGVYQTYVDSLSDDLKRVFHVRVHACMRACMHASVHTVASVHACMHF
jgi:hypothetical protein